MAVKVTTARFKHVNHDETGAEKDVVAIRSLTLSPDVTEANVLELAATLNELELIPINRIELVSTMVLNVEGTK